MRPIAPMLAMPSTPSSNRQRVHLRDLTARTGWLAQEKVDGLRAVLYSQGGTVRLFNRSGVEITNLFPEIGRVKPLIPDVVLDGELVADDGRFSTVATRGKQTNAFATAAAANPCHFVAFDLLRANDQDVMHLPLHVRLASMRGIVGRRRLVRLVRQSDDVQALWDAVVADGGEGIIAKRRTSLYLPGQRATSWVKFKAVQRLTAIAVGYERGVNREFGAIQLALLSGDTPVPIGKVGTGWTERQGEDLRRRLDAGQMFPIEVEALNRTDDNHLRFPVYRGERTDMPLTAATAEQLALLPVY